MFSVLLAGKIDYKASNAKIVITFYLSIHSTSRMIDWSVCYFMAYQTFLGYLPGWLFQVACVLCILYNRVQKSARKSLPWKSTKGYKANIFTHCTLTWKESKLPVKTYCKSSPCQTDK